MAARRPEPRRPPPPRSGAWDLGPRIAAALPAIAFALLIVGFGGWVFAAGIFALGAICLHELFQMFSFTRPSRLAGLAGLAGLLVAAQAGGRATVLLAFVCCLPLVFLLSMLQARPRGMPGVSVTMLGLAWIGLGFAHAVMLRDLPHGDGVVVSVLVGTFVGDTGAYVGGRTFGRRPLAPRISPNKTVEGLAIGFVAALFGVWFAGIYEEWMTGTQALIPRAAGGGAPPPGGLFASYLQRAARAEETSR